jgi:hypothetical protein
MLRVQTPEEQVPTDHPVRRIKALAEASGRAERQPIAEAIGGNTPSHTASAPSASRDRRPHRS